MHLPVSHEKPLNIATAVAFLKELRHSTLFIAIIAYKAIDSAMRVKVNSSIGAPLSLCSTLFIAIIAYKRVEGL